jgi:hypothetical protein
MAAGDAIVHRTWRRFPAGPPITNIVALSKEQT